jgi:hypothetical protein
VDAVSWGSAAAAVTVVATVQSVCDGASAFAARFAGERVVAEAKAIQARHLGTSLVNDASDNREDCAD